VVSKECSIRWKPTGIGSAGGAGVNEFDTRKIEAQIAQ
jgi:hypothetical protein